MKTQNILTVFAAGLLVLTGTAFMACAPATDAKTTDVSYAGTATKYFVAHQGGYIGEATVTTDKNGNVASAAIHEWQGPSGWSETSVGGEIVRVPDPLSNVGHTDAAIAGYQFYQYNATVKTWVQYNLNTAKTAFAASTKYERDFEGTMGNPIRAEAYAKAAADDTLVAVTITGVTVTVGKKASETVHYGHMDKNNAAATYMVMNGASSANSIGYRENAKALITFFKANPKVDYSTAVYKSLEVAKKTTDYATGTADDSKDYPAQTDNVWTIADAVTGATYSDFPMYATELQDAYLLALADKKAGDLRALK